MDPLINKWSVLQARFHRIKNALHGEDIAETSDAALQLYLSRLQALTNDTESLQNEITASVESGILVVHVATYTELMEQIEKLTIEAMSALHGRAQIAAVDSQGSSARGQNPHSSSGPRVDVKLPKIELPSFSGKLEEWFSFHDFFCASVHNNSKLSGAQKLQYLKSALKGEAALLIDAIPVTDGNYAEAWDILLQRYNNDREIVDAQLHKLFNLPLIKQGTAVELRGLLTVSSQCIRALKVLKEPVEHWDSLLIHLIKNKLDESSRTEWELTLKGTSKPSYKQFVEFLDVRARALSASKKAKPASSFGPASSGQGKILSAACVGTMQKGCLLCKGSHALHRCARFLKGNVSERKEILKRHSVCTNCLRASHQLSQCQAGNCRKCALKHHTLLHEDKEANTPPSSGSQSTDIASHVSEGSRGKQILLSTAIVHVRDQNGLRQPVRALLDSASQASFVSESCAQKLGLGRNHSHLIITGLGHIGVGRPRGSIQLSIHSALDPTFQLSTEAYVLPKVTKPLPSMPCSPSLWSHIQGLPLADPTFHIPSEIELLLGADVFGDIMRPGTCCGVPGTPTAIRTVFGWTLMGPANLPQSASPDPAPRIAVHHCDVQMQLSRFWELEEVPGPKILTEEESVCEQHFVSTHFRDPTGRYGVCLPFKNAAPRLGDSRAIALRRFYHLERKLQANPALAQGYKLFLDEYLGLNHMRATTPEELELPPHQTYYLPHHAVFREESTTTKLRVVFNASAKTSNGTSLNDHLMVGAKQQDDLLPLLVRFRIPAVAMTADLEKMYRQVWIHPQDTNYQRILWRFNPEDPVTDYNLTTITYGMASSPFLATRVLKELARVEELNLPKASSVLANDFYMDDMLTGADTTEAAIALQRELVELTRKGGLTLRKWASNDPALLNAIPASFRGLSPTALIQESDTVRALGLHWKTSSDTLIFLCQLPSVGPEITKRGMLSDISKVFDPLGLLTPSTIRCKVLLQHLWRLNLGWDDPLPQELKSKWLSLREDLKMLEDIQIPRCITKPDHVTAELHAFCDASEKSYAAAVYLRTQSAAGKTAVHLIAAKSRVAPLKTIPLPRLELWGAVLLVRLLKVVQQTIRIPVTSIHAWTDSTIVLGWIGSPPHRWKTFVANRASEIQTTFPDAQWHHVAGINNPADCASRGISATDLRAHSLWWQGPTLLSSVEIPFDALGGETVPSTLPDSRSKSLIAAPCLLDTSLLERYSSLSKLIRVTAYIQRFIFNSRHDASQRRSGPLMVSELTEATQHWVRVSQQHDFAEDLEHLQSNKPLPSHSRLTPLCPFIDEHGIIRVGGRLKHARLSPDHKHPMLLPQGKLAELVIRDMHARLLHGGPQLVLSNIQRKFWIIGARQAVRFIIRKCMTCARQRASGAKQIMADLPEVRVNPSRPFLRCGVDYTGPFSLRTMNSRGSRTYKAYLVVFVCLATRAMHLELVGSLTTEAFLAAFKRFLSRRGKCLEIFSDCGTTFQGADKELKKLIRLTHLKSSDNPVANWLAQEGITWHFNPPAAPHFGGIWEAGVKSIKYHLRRILGSNTLTYEEMQTITCQIECCLNSRPLTAVSTDPSDFSALTPGHFLVGESLVALPEPRLHPENITRTSYLTRWQHCQRLVHHFWKRWSSEYLARLQQRPKWTKKQPNPKPGDLVLVRDVGPTPTEWNLARITEVHPGDDGQVRVVTLITPDRHELKRPIVKISPLPLD